jgi:hypothetical protein
MWHIGLIAMRVVDDHRALLDAPTPRIATCGWLISGRP